MPPTPNPKTQPTVEFSLEFPAHVFGPILDGPGGPSYDRNVRPARQKLRVATVGLVSAILSVLLIVLSPAAVCGERYAIVVGVNACPDFRLPDGSKPRPLRGAENDARDVAAALRRHFAFRRERIWLVTGEQGTRAAVRQAFRDVTDAAQPDDVFVFHFSGHGTQLDDRRPFDEPDRLDEALCTYDARADGSNLVLDDELGLWLEDLPAGRVTVILDCCHAGTGIKDPDAEVVPRYLPMAVSRRPGAAPGEPWRELSGSTKSLGRKTTAFFACRADQQAYERRLLEFSPPRRAGQFTHYFLEGIAEARADADGNGLIDNQEAFDYAAGRLDETFNRTRPDSAGQQQPVMETDAEAAPVFGQRTLDLGDTTIHVRLRNPGNPEPAVEAPMVRRVPAPAGRASVDSVRQAFQPDISERPHSG